MRRHICFCRGSFCSVEIEAFGSEYVKSSWGDHQTKYCTRLMDVFNNSVLSVSTPAYPSAIEISPDINLQNHISDEQNAEATDNVTSQTVELTQSECENVALAYMKEHIHPYLKNPASLQIISVSGSKTEGTEYLFIINYTAMNSLGGYTPGNYYCSVDYLTGKVTMGGMI